MRFKNVSKRLYVGFDLGEHGNGTEKSGIPVRIGPGKKGCFSVLNKSVELAVAGKVIVPDDKEAKQWASDKGL